MPVDFDGPAISAIGTAIDELLRASEPVSERAEQFSSFEVEPPASRSEGFGH